MDVINSIILDPRLHELFSIVKGFRNGIVYGTKVRFPHALVMTFLFKNGSLRDKILGILRATKSHARGLAFFVTTYKVLMLLQRSLSSSGKNTDLHTFIAGFVGGYFVFGEKTSVNQQIILYLFSRVTMGLINTAMKKGDFKAPPKSFALFAACCWGIVMVLFRRDKNVLQDSLKNSMTYLYEDSTRWTSLKTLLWHNK